MYEQKGLVSLKFLKGNTEASLEYHSIKSPSVFFHLTAIYLELFIPVGFLLNGECIHCIRKFTC